VLSLASSTFDTGDAYYSLVRIKCASEYCGKEVGGNYWLKFADTPLSVTVCLYGCLVCILVFIVGKQMIYINVRYDRRV